MSDIYNKNAREKALLEEAYGSVYNEGQFWGRDDLVQKGKEEDIARGAVKLVGKTKDGNYTSATLPGDDPKIKELEKQGYKREPIEDAEEPGPSEVQQMENHAKGVKMALEALEMFKDELHIDGHPEDVNVNELADAHDQLSRALHWLLDETDVEYIIGGRATQRSEAQSQKEDFGGHDRESWHEFMRDYEEHGN